jgi:hypothetical protein
MSRGEGNTQCRQRLGETPVRQMNITMINKTKGRIASSQQNGTLSLTIFLKRIGGAVSLLMKWHPSGSGRREQDASVYQLCGAHFSTLGERILYTVTR